MRHEVDCDPTGRTPEVPGTCSAVQPWRKGEVLLQKGVPKVLTRNEAQTTRLTVDRVSPTSNNNAFLGIFRPVPFIKPISIALVSDRSQQFPSIKPSALNNRVYPGAPGLPQFSPASTVGSLPRHKVVRVPDFKDHRTASEPHRHRCIKNTAITHVMLKILL